MNPAYLALVRPLLLLTTWEKARESVNKGRGYLPYLAYRTRFDVSQTRGGLAAYGLKAPPIRTYMETLIEYAKPVNWGAASKRPVAPGAPVATS